MPVALISLSYLKVKLNRSAKEFWINLIIVAIKISLSERFCFNQIFDTKSRLHINLSVMGRPFKMYTIISMYAEILIYSSVMENNPDGQLLKVLGSLYLYLELSQVAVLWKVSKRNEKTRNLFFFLSLLTLLDVYQHLQTFFVIFSSYRFQMKQISTLETCCVITSNQTGKFTFWA